MDTMSERCEESMGRDYQFIIVWMHQSFLIGCHLPLLDATLIPQTLTRTRIVFCVIGMRYVMANTTRVVIRSLKATNKWIRICHSLSNVVADAILRLFCTLQLSMYKVMNDSVPSCSSFIIFTVSVAVVSADKNSVIFPLVLSHCFIFCALPFPPAIYKFRYAMELLTNNYGIFYFRVN